MRSGLQSSAAGLSDAELLRRVVVLAAGERHATVELVAHLAELDTRRLYLGEGFGSLFGYCVGALRLAEHAAYNRIEAARASRRFPAVLDLLADGSLNLSTVRLLAPHLQPENFDDVVARAKGKSKREVEVLVARLAPRTDVTASVRRLPTPAPLVAAHGAVMPPMASPPAAPRAEALPAVPPTAWRTTGAPPADAPAFTLPASTLGREAQTVPPLAPIGRCAGSARAGATEPAASRPVVAPLAPGRYRVQFTIGEAAHGKLRQAQELLRREIPDGDPGTIFERALALLLEDIARKKLALLPTPPTKPSRRDGHAGAAAGAAPQAVRTRSRHIPARVRRGVWLRDGGRCAFVAPSGQRCTERAFLEFHHREPYAIGGEATLGNISLRCRAHNVHETGRVFASSAGAGRDVVANSPRGELGPS